MVEVYSPAVHMKKMTRRQMLYMIRLIGEWMIEEKREGYLIQLLYILQAVITLAYLRKNLFFQFVKNLKK